MKKQGIRHLSFADDAFQDTHHTGIGRCCGGTEKADYPCSFSLPPFVVYNDVG